MKPVIQFDAPNSSATTPATFHHVGFVVPSIHDVAENVAQSIAANWDGKIYHDPIQKVRVAFLYPCHSVSPAMELVEPAGSDSPVLSFLKRGGGIHHLCYEVADLEERLRQSRSRGDLIVRSPAPAVAFQGRRIAWVYTTDKLLLEFLECPGMQESEQPPSSPSATSALEGKI